MKSLYKITMCLYWIFHSFRFNNSSQHNYLSFIVLNFPACLQGILWKSSRNKIRMQSFGYFLGSPCSGIPPNLLWKLTPFSILRIPNKMGLLCCINIAMWRGYYSVIIILDGPLYHFLKDFAAKPDMYAFILVESTKLHCVLAAGFMWHNSY